MKLKHLEGILLAHHEATFRVGLDWDCAGLAVAQAKVSSKDMLNLFDFDVEIFILHQLRLQLIGVPDGLPSL